MNTGKLLNVLSIEDSKEDFELICGQLTKAGYTTNITRVEEEGEFVAALQSTRYDIILSGFNIQGFDIFTALKLSNEICPDVPFICVSGFIGEESTMELIKSGAVDYVSKDRLRRLPLAIKRALKDAIDKELHRRAEKALMESEQNYRTLADSGQTLIWATSTDSNCNYFNNVWLLYRGQTFDHEKETGFANCIHPDDLHSRMTTYLDAFQKRDKFNVEYRLLRYDGEYRWIQENGSPRYTSTGDFLGFIGQCQDINERKQAELFLQTKNEELQKLNAEKDKFFAIIAHDLRSPFNTLLGFTQIMVEDLSELKHEEIAKMAKAMRTSATGLYSLLENLLVWSGSQRGTTSFVPVQFSLKDVFQENLKLLQETAHAKRIDISIAIPEDIMVFADINMIGSTIRNLVSNALKFTPPNGQISIIAKSINENLIEISIKDSGMGMSEEMRSKLFQLNENIGRNGTDGEPSSGLGLIICKDFIEKNGGNIWAESVENEGSTFYFTLLSSMEIDLKTTLPVLLGDASETTSPEKLKVLIVDDDEASEMLISIALKTFCKEIIKARTGIEAVEACRLNPDIDLILMDFKMPLMNGLEATQLIREFNTDVIIIAQTAYETSSDYHMALAAGSNDYILKPFNLHSLRKMIRKYFKI